MKGLLRLGNLTLIGSMGCIFLLFLVACETEPPGIPNDVSYSVLTTRTIPSIKRSLEVRLNKKVPEEILRRIAQKLKSDGSRDYDRTFITYYLPGMKVGAGAWATSHFDPALRIQILGLSTGATKSRPAKAGSTDQKVIGRWIDEVMASRITIFKKGRLVYVEHLFKDGSTGEIEVFEEKIPRGQGFIPVKASATGDHWVIDSRGNLQLRDSEGLIRTAMKLR